MSVAVVTVCLVAAAACVAFAGYAALRTNRPDRRGALWLLGYSVALLVIAGGVAAVHEKVSPAAPAVVASAAAASASAEPAATVQVRDETELAYPLDTGAVEDFQAGETLASGATTERLCLANYHARAVALGAGRSYAWWTDCSTASGFQTVGDLRKGLALPPAWGARDEVAVACVPVGTALTYVRGEAASQGRAYPGGGLQYRVLNFDTDWIVAQEAVPAHGTLRPLDTGRC